MIDAAITPDSTAARVLERLQGYRLKREPSGQYRADCPWRPGSNSHSLRIRVNDGEHGAWNYFAGAGGGSLYDLATRLGVPLPERAVTVESTKRAYTGGPDYAQAHGLTWADLQAAGYAETTKDGRPALSFPTATGTRYRFLDGQKPEYKSPFEYRKCWYRLDVALGLAEASGQPLVLCNGEISTLAAQHRGVAAVALGGGSELKIPAFLLDELKAQHSGPVVIALDCDAKGRSAAAQALETLTEAGLDATVVDLGGTDGFDLADFVRLHGEDSVAELQRRIITSEPVAAGLFPLLTLAELWALPAPRWLLRDVVAAGKTTMIWGASGSGKTFYGVDLAMSIGQSHVVVYVAAEDAEGVSIRTEGWMLHHRPETPPQVYTIVQKPKLLDASHIDALQGAVAAVKAELVIIDTLGRTIAGANENDRGQMRLVTEACDRLNMETGAAVVLIHHGRKDSATFSGAGTLKDDAYTVVEVSTDGDGLITVENEKAKNSPKFEAQRYRLLEVTTSRLDPDTGKPIVTCVLAPAEQVVDTGTTLTPAQRKILDVLLLNEEHGFKASQIIGLARMADRSFYSVAKSLRQKGYIAPGVKGDPYFITPAGKAALTGAGHVALTTAADLAEALQPNAEQQAHFREQLASRGTDWGWEYMDKTGGRDAWPAWARLRIKKIERETKE